MGGKWMASVAQVSGDCHVQVAVAVGIDNDKKGGKN